MNERVYYEARAEQYATHFGIISYSVKDNLMIYYKNHEEGDLLPNGRRKVHCYKHTVNLDNMQSTVERSKRVYKVGWLNA